MANLLNFFGEVSRMLIVLLVAAWLLICHELGHILTTVALGGRFQGVVFRGFALGVVLDLSRLSMRGRLGTVWAGVGAEMAATGAVGVLAGMGFLDMRLFAWALIMLAADATLNLGPWWSASDGALIRQWRHVAQGERG